LPGFWYFPEKAIRNNAGMVPNNAGMVPRENLEESVVRTGRDFPAGGNPCLSKGLTSVQASFNLLVFNNETMKQFTICILLYIIYIDIFY